MVGIVKNGRRHAADDFELDESAFVYQEGQIVMLVERYARARLEMWLNSVLSAPHRRYDEKELPTSIDDITIEDVKYIPPTHEHGYYGEDCTYYNARIRVEYSWAMSPEDLTAWKASEVKRLEAARKKKERDKIAADKRAAKEKIRIDKQTQRQVADLKARAAKDPELAALLKQLVKDD